MGQAEAGGDGVERQLLCWPSALRLGYAVSLVVPVVLAVPGGGCGGGGAPPSLKRGRS